MKAVLFDFDGTLFRLHTDYARLRVELEALLGHAAPRVYDALEAAAPDVRARALALIARYELDAIDRAELLDGARELLAHLRARAIKIAIVSRNARATIEAAFARERLAPPDAIVAVEDTPRAKPDAAPGERALALLAVSARDAIVVGDTWHDMRMAAALGMHRVLVYNARLDRPPVDEADRVIHSLGELDVDEAR